ncbi:hypothetical protein M514_08560 [Trichuris suis]|uniref:Phosphatidylserine synthase n=1 Tax=Trichuris suis TaxID=68888 RepID=A0A085NE11_9BILA|nr:hypothetical protein M514_08560 [Trichuris suis]
MARQPYSGIQFVTVNERPVDDISIEFLYKPHTLTGLAAVVLLLLYNAFTRSDQSYPDNIWMGLKVVLFTFLVISMISFPNGPFTRPHPVIWRIVFGLSVFYLLALQFLLFQSFGDVKAILRWWDPVHLSKLKLEEKAVFEYAVNCSQVDLARIWSHLDVFAIGHFLGWALKAVLIRHSIICWYTSVTWEITEIFFTHLLPNFRECWWDAIVLDVLLCNGLGIWFGMFICRKLEMRHYHWESIKTIRGTRGKLKRAVLQLTPASWTKIEWMGPQFTLKRIMQVWLLVVIWQVTELNTFFIKHIFAIDTRHPLVSFRLVIICLITAPAIRQYYMYITDPDCKRLGTQCWVYWYNGSFSAVTLTEAILSVKFSRQLFAQTQLLSLCAWLIVLLIGTVLCVYLCTVIAGRTEVTKEMLAEDVVPVQKVGSSYLVWDVDHVRTLREKYRIIGNLAGPFRAHKQQNDQLGLPLQISDNEAAVLLGMPEAFVLAEGKIAIFETENRAPTSPNTLQNCEPVPIEKFLCPVLPSRHLAHKEEEKMRYVPKNIVSALRRNFYITSGLKFGCHFLLYPGIENHAFCPKIFVRLGDPLRYHASHMFIYLPRHQRLTAKEMTAYCRLANHVRKTVMIGTNHVFNFFIGTHVIKFHFQLAACKGMLSNRRTLDGISEKEVIVAPDIGVPAKQAPTSYFATYSTLAKHLAHHLIEYWQIVAFVLFCWYSSRLAMSFPPRFGVHQLASAAFMPAYGAVPVVPVLPTAAHYLMPTLSSPSIIPPQPPKGIPPQALTPQMVKRQEILMERPPVTTVFVGNIHERVSNDLIKAMLMKCGNIMNWKRIQGPSGKYQAFGFCEYDHPDSTLRALRLLHDWPLGDKKLVLKCDEKNKKTLIEFINKRRELYGKPPLVLEGDQLPADDEMKKEDEQFRKALQQLVVEMAGDLCSSVSNGSYGQKSPTLSGKGGNLDIESLDRDRKEYIAKEIIQFREAHKEEKESRPKSGTNDVDRKSASPSGEDQITSSKRPRERSRSHHSARSGSSESRQSAKKSRRRDESRDSSLDRRKIAARQRLSEADEDDAYERRRVERRIREKEAAFRERLAKWENREQRKAAERQEKAAKLAQLAAVEGHDRQVLRLFLEDYDDSKSDEQFYRGKALEIRLKDYREEAERDARDRQKEKEELEQLRKEIANGKNGKENAGNVSSGGGWRPVCTPAGETIRSESAPAKGGDKASIEKVITSTVSGTVNFSLASSSSGNQPMGFAGLKLGAPTTAAATNAPSVKPHFFAEDETQEEPPARKLVPLEYTEEERRALIDAPYSGVQLTAEEKRRVAKVIIEKIPTSKEELFAQEILWDYVDSYVIEKRIRPWVGKKIVEYIGEEEVSLVDFICQKVKQKAKPQEILDDISMPVESKSTGRDTELDFLGDFEELVDYDLTTNSSHRTDVKSKVGVTTNKQPKKRKKRKKKEAQSVTDAETTLPRKILKSDVEEASALGASLHEWIQLYVPVPILQALSDMKFLHPTAIQQACLPSAIRDGMDILGAAETGSGKTLAFAIPVVAGLLAATEKSIGPSALILTPTRELAMQIKKHVSAIAKYTDIKIGLLVGGLSMQKQERLLKSEPDIIIATPGRIWTLVEDGCEQLSNIRNVRYLVIDEIDRMVEKGHFEELSKMLHFLNSSPKGSVNKRQTLAFSATLTFVHPLPKRLLAKKMRPMTSEDKIENLISLLGLRKRRQLVDLTAKSGLASTLTTSCLFCSSLERKDVYVYYFLVKYPGRTLIFANSISCVRRLRSLLSKLKVNAFGLHAEMDQKKRFTNLEKFERLENSVLVASDVAARGLDIKNVDHVIHYQVPKASEVYVHRSGRTARQSKQGLSLMLVDKQDVLSYRRICKTVNDGRDFSLFPIDKQDLRKYVARVQLAAEIESMEHRMKSQKAKKSWFRNAAKEADLPWDDEEDTTEQDSEVQKEWRRRMSILEEQLLRELREDFSDVTPKSKYPLFAKAFTDDTDEPKSAIAAQARGGSTRKPKFAVKLMRRKKQRRQGARSVHKKGKKKTSAKKRR